MSQVSVLEQPLHAYEGKVENFPERVESSIGSELIYFGKALSQSNTLAIDEVVPTVQMYTSGQKFAGIAIADLTLETIPNVAYGAHIINSAVPRLMKGRIWVKSGDAVDDLSKSVFVRSADAAGTPASITDTTTYAVADQDTLDLVFNVTDYAAQTVLFNVATTTAAVAASQINEQVKGISAAVVGGQVKVTTDATGDAITISVTAGTSALTWDTPVAGTGDTTTPPGNSRGSFRAVTTTGYTDLGAIADVKWVAGKTINSETFGLLSINEG